MKTILSILLVSSLYCTIAAYSGQDIIKRPANSWIAYPKTQLLSVTPPGDSYPNIMAVSGVSAIVTSWSGAVLDPIGNNFIVWGGGHNDYFGNELYSFNIDSLKWTRLTDPCASPNLCQQVNADGTPNSRHTYSGLAFITHANRFFASGGALACPPGSCSANKTWTFDMATKTWHDMNPSGTGPRTECEDNCAYDPYTKKVYYFDSQGMYAYDYDSNNWTQVNSGGRYNYTCAVDTKRHLLFNIGHGTVLVYDLTKTPLTVESWTTTGGAEFIAKGAVGLDYDPVSDRIVGWHGGSIYALDVDARTWTAFTAANTPIPCSNGTFGRWRYVPAVNAFVNINKVSDNVLFYKLTAGSGISIEASPRLFGLTPEIEVFPNPFTENITFFVNRGCAESATLYSADGRSVKNIDINRPSFSRGSLPAGLYVLKVKIKDRMLSKRIILSK